MLVGQPMEVLELSRDMGVSPGPLVDDVSIEA